MIRSLLTPRVELGLKQFAIALEALRKMALTALMLASVSAPSHAIEIGVTPQNDLEQLSEILGALHYLHGICGYPERDKWHRAMQRLLDAEAPTGEPRSRLVISFNGGYRGFGKTYRTCTPSARIAIRHFESWIRFRKPSWQWLPI